MRSTSDGTFKGSSAGGPAQSGGLLSRDELALPAVCGQTGKPFLMVVRRQGRGVVELIRAVGIAPAPPVRSVPVRHADPPPRTRTVSSGAGRGISEDREVSFQALNISARIDIGTLYAGCPYCRAEGYFHCSGCRMFSCWDSYNEKPHLDHTDVWCEACQSWRCTSDEGEDDDSLSELTAYAARESAVELRSRIAPEPAGRGLINRANSIRGYLR